MGPTLMTINNASMTKQLLLAHGLRADLRGPSDLAELVIEFGQEPGEVDLRWGQTRIYAKTTATVVEPSSDRPYEGFLVITTESSPMAHDAYEAAPSGEEELLLNRLLDKGLRRSRALDLESLCLVAGEKVWSIRITLHVLANAGSLSDSMLLAASVALRHFRKPEVTIVGTEITVHDPRERVPRSLEISQTPLPLTWSLYNRGDKSSLALLNTSSAEEALRSTSITFAVTANSREICLVQKLGGAPVPPESILHCLDQTWSHAKDLDLQTAASIAKDNDRMNMSART